MTTQNNNFEKMTTQRNYNVFNREVNKKNLNYLFALEVFRVGECDLISKIDMSVEFFIAKNNSVKAFEKYREKFTPSYDFYVYAGYFAAYNFIGVELHAGNQITLGFLKGCAQSPNVDWIMQVYEVIKDHVILDCMYFYFLMLFHRFEVLDKICVGDVGEIMIDILPRVIQNVLPCPQVVKYLLLGVSREKLLIEIFEFLTSTSKNEELFFDTVRAIDLDKKIVRRLADQYSLYKIKREFC